MEDLYILSDLHLGEGRSAETLRFSRLEVFFYDQELSNFLDRVLVEAMATHTPARLILNGDVFDFLTVTRLPTAAELRDQRMRLHRNEHKFGLSTTAQKSAWKLGRIIAGHPSFFRAILRFAAAGFPVTILRGNHDAELFWDLVRDRFYAEMDALARVEQPMLDPATLRERIAFEPWFYMEPGRIWVEHGHQYEASNSFRYHMNPVLPARYSDAGAPVLDYPTGSLFVRNVYNKVKLIDPYSNYYVSLDQYMGIVGSANFFAMARTFGLHLPFFMRAIRNARFFELHGMEDIAAVHRDRVREEAKRRDLDPALLEEIDTLMVEPVGKTKYSLIQEMLRPFARSTATATAIGLLSIAGWFLIFTLIQSTGWIVTGILTKASLMALFAVITVTGLFVLMMWVHQRVRIGASLDATGDTCFERAEHIAELLDVPLVSMGHTHRPDLRPFRRRSGAYANSGTWILNRSASDAIKPKSRQFTFVRVKGLTMDILRWDDAGRRWEPVPLLEDYRPTPFERLLGEDDGEDMQ